MAELPLTDAESAFLRAALVDRGRDHSSGTLETAEGILGSYPDVAPASIFTAAVLGDAVAVRRFLQADPTRATARGGPYGWDALTHVCFSRYLRLDPGRSAGLVDAAIALLDAGADANTGWFESDHLPGAEWESVLYGAAGVARHPAMTRLLLERGAEPNDAETPYHAAETNDLAVLQVLVGSGRLTADSLATLLLRKADWHHMEGIRYLLEHGADPNRQTPWQYTPLHHAIRRDNALESIALFLDHGGDPNLNDPSPGGTPGRTAARRGRRDLLVEFERRGIALSLEGVDRLIAACAWDDQGLVRDLVGREPALLPQLLEQASRLLVEFAGTGNAGGVARLLDLGIPVGAVLAEGDGYWDLAPGSTALHNAAWRGRHDTVGLLLERGAPVNARDERGCTPLRLAIRATVDSHWTWRRSTASIAALIEAGASVGDISLPTGYAAADILLHAAGGESRGPR